MSIVEQYEPIKTTLDGIRYKKKRKYNELANEYGVEINEFPRNIESKGKRKKQSQDDELGLAKNIEKQRNNIENNLKIENEKAVSKRDKSKESKSVLQNNNNNLPASSKQVDNDSKNSTLPVLFYSATNLESDVKKQLMSEYDRIKTASIKIEDNFNKQYLNMVIKGLENFCLKNAKNATKNIKIKVANLFSDDSFVIEFQKYSPHNTLINLELLFFDILVNKNSLYTSLMDLDSPNIGNIFLFYFSQTCLIKIIKSILPIVRANLEKFSDVLTIKIKNVDNLANENKMNAIQIFQGIFRENYNKSTKMEKQTKRGRLLSNDFEDIIYSDIFNFMGKNVDIRTIHSFDYDSYKDLLTLNHNFLDTQLRNSDKYNKIIKYGNEQIMENNQKKIKLSLIKKDTNSNNKDIFQKISNLDVFYADTSQLIRNYLED